MKIAVISGFEAGHQAAHVVNTVNMAQGFAKLGHDVSIICYDHRTQFFRIRDLNRIYGIREAIRWIRLPRPVILSEPLNANEAFAWLAQLVVWGLRPDFVFARSYIVPCLTARFGRVTVAETHAHPDNRTTPFLRMITGVFDYAKFEFLVTISDVLSQHYQSLGVPDDKILVLPTGVDIDRFTRPEELPASPYPTNKPNIAYMGHLYDYKGIPTILEGARLLPEYHFHLIGGTPQDVERHQDTITEQGIENVTLHGIQPQASIPPYLWHADLLLLPPSADHPSAEWTSPVKLGEYLASGTPIIATRIPALRDWLTEKEVTFIEPDSPTAMKDAILHVLEHPQNAQSRAKQGLELAQEFSYTNRARIILEKCGF